MELGKKQLLVAVRKKEFGVYLARYMDDKDSVLLPIKQVPADLEIGDPIEVFVYRDSSDRLIATTREAKLQIGELARLRVKETGKIGAFLDWGLEKDLLLPFKEQTTKLSVGQEYLVSLYIDRSGRLCATMDISPFLRTDHSYQKDDQVEGTIYRIVDHIGAFVAVEDTFVGLLPNREMNRSYHIGEHINVRIARVYEDGKIDLAVREKAYLQMDIDAAKVMEKLEKEGCLDFTDKADAALIKERMQMSKAGFKRAVGRLLKQGKIEILDDKIVAKKR